MDILTMETVQSENLKAWETFITRHLLLPTVQPLITESWERCWAVLDPLRKRQIRQLSSDHLLSMQVANFNLLSISRPIMEDIHQMIQGTSTAILISNSAGYLLDMIGDEKILLNLESDGIEVGALLGEMQIGTNAVALALIERIALQVVGAEHYLKQFHNYADAAAPIFDPGGNPLGILSLITDVSNYSAHSPGLVVAGARAIEGLWQTDLLLLERNTQLTSLNTILSTIDEGVLVWNSENVMIHANASALKILELRQDQLLGRPIDEHIQFPAFFMEAVKNHESLNNVETNINIDERSVTCFMSLRFVRSSKGLEDIILTLRTTQEVRQLVRRQLGVDATLTLENLIGLSPEIRRARNLARTAAAAKASVLIRGESGTGKNMLARAIHNQGPNREGPFVVFACTSIPGELILTELIGVAEGVHDGKPGGRPSKLELADGGSIFFKDVEALPLEAQSILLNVLELGIVQRIGSQHPIEVNTRIIASSADNLEKRVAEGSFRADLFYRLSPFEIHLPPLKERLEDLPSLIDNILTRLTRQDELRRSVPFETMMLLKEYEWPGNIRELEAVMERMIIQAGNSAILTPRHLPDFRSSSNAKTEGQNKPVSLREAQKEAILKAARHFKGNVTKMSAHLGVGRTTLWRRLKEFDIGLDDFRASH